MADKDYCPEYNARKFQSVRNPLMAGDYATAAQACAAITLGSSKAALDIHAELLTAYIRHLQNLVTLSDDDRLDAPFPTEYLAPDKDAETLRRAACDVHVDVLYCDTDELQGRDFEIELIVTDLCLS